MKKDRKIKFLYIIKIVITFNLNYNPKAFPSLVRKVSDDGGIVGRSTIGAGGTNLLRG